MPKPLCPFDCGRAMFVDRRDGESDLEWWNRERGMEYHPRDCLGHKMYWEEWSLKVNGVPDTDNAEYLKGKIKIVVEFTLDAQYYNPTFLKEILRGEFGWDRKKSDGSVPLGVTSGGYQWRQVNRKVKSIVVSTNG